MKKLVLVIGIVAFMFLTIKTQKNNNDAENLAQCRLEMFCKLDYDAALEKFLDEGLKLVLMGERKMIFLDKSDLFYGIRERDGNLEGIISYDLKDCESFIWLLRSHSE